MNSNQAALRMGRPNILADDAAVLLLRFYGLRATKMEECCSFIARTYRVDTLAPDGQVGQFMLKIMSSEATAETVESQTAVVDHLGSCYPELGCQIPVPDLEGNLVSYAMLPNSVTRGSADNTTNLEIVASSAIRLFHYICGDTVKNFSPLPLPFFLDLGKHIGKFQQALQTFPGNIEPLERADRANNPWHNLSQVTKYLVTLSDDVNRELSREVIAEFQDKVVPIRAQLRTGIVHHDANYGNILLRQAQPPATSFQDLTPSGPTYDIVGIIDFDECCCTALVYELANLVMYMMFCSDSPLDAAANMVAGFEKVTPLLREERNLFRVLVAGRFVQSLVLGAYYFTKYPANTYLLNTQDMGWHLLRVWWGTNWDNFEKLMQQNSPFE